MIGQKTIFEEELNGLQRADSLKVLYELVSTKKGVQRSLDLYLQEHWTKQVVEFAKENPELEKIHEKIEELSSKADNPSDNELKVFPYRKDLKPVVIFNQNYTQTKYRSAEEIAQILSNGAVSVFEEQVRCSFKKPEFIREYGEISYKKPLAEYLGGSFDNEDVDGIVSLTVDFDVADLSKNDIETMFPGGKENSTASYVYFVNQYVTLFMEKLPLALQPTSVRFTGRGFQFVYLLSETFYLNKKDELRDQQIQFVKDTIMWLRKSLEIEHNSFYEDLGSAISPKRISFTLDKAFENNLYQMRRVPGSLNEKSGLYCCYIYLTSDLEKDSVYLQDLIEYCKDNYKDSHKNQESFKKVGLFYNASKQNSISFCESRIEALKDIANKRYNEKALVGSRHNILTQAANLLADLEKHKSGIEPDYDIVFKKAIAFQMSCFKDKSLTKKESESAVKGVLKRRERILNRGDSTNLKNNTIAKFLGFSEEEDQVFRGTYKKSKRKAASSVYKDELSEKVHYAYNLHEEGYSLKEIADVLNVSKSTVHRYITTFYPRIKKEERWALKDLATQQKKETSLNNKFMYHAVAKKMAEALMNKKIKKMIYKLMLKESCSKSESVETLLNKDVVFEHLELVISQTFSAIEFCCNTSELKSLIKMMDVLCSKLYQSKSLRNMINEYFLIALVDQDEFKRSRSKFLERVDKELSILIQKMYWKNIAHIKVPAVKTFYPNNALAGSYVAHQDTLPFSLLYTNKIALKKYGSTLKELKRERVSFTS